MLEKVYALLRLVAPDLYSEIRDVGILMNGPQVRRNKILSLQVTSSCENTVLIPVHSDPDKKLRLDKKTSVETRACFQEHLKVFRTLIITTLTWTQARIVKNLN